MPSATFEHAVTVDASADDLWMALMEPETWENIGPVDRVWDPVHTDGLLMGYRWSTRVGGTTLEGTARAVDHLRPERYLIDLETSEVAGRISLRMEPVEGGTELHARLEFSTKGVLSSMMFPMIRDAVGRGFADQIDRFATGVAGGD